MRLGILTGGGDCPGLNAVIRAAVMRTVRTYGGHMLGIENGWRGLFENRTRDLDLSAISGILPRGGTMLGHLAHRSVPHDRVASTALRKGLARASRSTACWCAAATARWPAAARLAEEGVPVVGIPKTIDNDVRGTDASFGFDTALTTVVRAVDALHSTAESHDRVLVLEVMGRATGWLAVCAGIAGGADVVVAPEEPVSVARDVRVHPQPRRARARFQHRRGGRGRGLQARAGRTPRSRARSASTPRDGGATAGSASGWRRRSSRGSRSRRARSRSATCSAAARRPRSTACSERAWASPRWICRGRAGSDAW